MRCAALLLACVSYLGRRLRDNANIGLRVYCVHRLSGFLCSSSCVGRLQLSSTVLFPSRVACNDRFELVHFSRGPIQQGRAAVPDLRDRGSRLEDGTGGEQLYPQGVASFIVHSPDRLEAAGTLLNTILDLTGCSSRRCALIVKRCPRFIRSLQGRCLWCRRVRRMRALSSGYSCGLEHFGSCFGSLLLGRERV